MGSKNNSECNWTSWEVKNWKEAETPECSTKTRVGVLVEHRSETQTKMPMENPGYSWGHNMENTLREGNKAGNGRCA